MQIFVTGGAGFIGSNFTERLLQIGHDVVTLDNLDPYYDLGLENRNRQICRQAGEDRFEFVEGLMTDQEVVDEFITTRDIDVIFHKAVKVGVRPSVTA